MVEIRRVVTRADLDEAWKIRFEVFVNEQHVPADEEVDDHDCAESTHHVLAVDEHGPVGTARLLGSADDLHIGRVAVLPRGRGKQVGAKLMAALEQLAVELYGPVTIALSAQVRVIGFYQRLGYELVDGEPYLDAGIPHRDMTKHVS